MDTSQLRTILWLRWRLTQNQWARHGAFSKFISIFAVVAGAIIGFSGAIGGLLAGALGLDDARPLALLGIWDAIIAAFLFFWMAGIVSDIQRSETIDIGRMLHLPVSIRQIFFINYIASLLTLIIILFLPGMLGLAVGLTLSRGPLLILLLPLVVGFIFMITAWTYCLRGWLATLMVNPRRRRTVIAVVTFAFILLAQMPNLLGQAFRVRDHRSGPPPQQTPSVVGQTPSVVEETPQADTDAQRRKFIESIVLLVHNAVPLLWVPNGAMSLAQGNVLPMLWSTAGVFLLGGLGLRRAYRSTIRFYEGQATERKKAKPRKGRAVADAPAPGAQGRFMERRLPGIPDEAAATALASFRSLMRAPEVKMALATNFLMLLLFGGISLVPRSHSTPEAIKPFMATGAIAVAFFGLVQLMFNLFGYDRGGFRALVLLPTPRYRVLLGKNLALFPGVMCIGCGLLLFVTLIMHLSPVVTLAALLQLLAAFLLLSTAGNAISTFVPYRVTPGSMKPTKMRGLTSLLMILTHLLFPITMAPLFLAPGLGLLASKLGWAQANVVNLSISLLLLAISTVVYRVSLPGLGTLLERREKAILDVVTHEVE